MATRSLELMTMLGKSKIQLPDVLPLDDGEVVTVNGALNGTTEFEPEQADLTQLQLGARVGPGTGTTGIDLAYANYIAGGGAAPTGGVIAVYDGSAYLLGDVNAPTVATSWVVMHSTGAGGAAGATGPIGPQGPIGVPGTVGVAGPTGPTGTIGVTGPAGPTGAAGAVGVAGPQGVPGLKGLDGAAGGVGSVGTQGIQGVVGPTGAQGIPGIQGVQGAGIAFLGTKADKASLPTTGNTDGDIWLTTADSELNVWGGTSWTSMTNIKGTQGNVGATGAQGPIGLTGLQGINYKLKGTALHVDILTKPNVEGDVWIDSTMGATFGIGYIADGAGAWTDIGRLVGPDGPRGNTGGQGIQGIQGIQGEAYTLKGTTAEATLPTTGLVVGDTYILNDVAKLGEAMTWDGTAWQNVGMLRGTQGVQGVVGPTGPQGIQGLTGAQGVGTKLLGSDILTAIVAHPTPTIGDLYIALNTDAVNAPTSVVGDGIMWDGAAWTNIGPIRGPAGLQGPAGTATITLANNLTETDPAIALAAPQAKALVDLITPKSIVEPARTPVVDDDGTSVNAAHYDHKHDAAYLKLTDYTLAGGVPQKIKATMLLYGTSHNTVAHGDHTHSGLATGRLFDPALTYEVGDIVTDNSTDRVVYVCNTASPTPHAWVATEWTRVGYDTAVQGEVDAGLIDDKTVTPLTLDNSRAVIGGKAHDIGKDYLIGDIVVEVGTAYMAIGSMTAGTFADQDLAGKWDSIGTDVASQGEVTDGFDDTKIVTSLKLANAGKRLIGVAI